MFDTHSYDKGGLILHMLRNYVGDEAFFKALNVYLTDNEYQSVEIHDLRLASRSQLLGLARVGRRDPEDRSLYPVRE